MTISVTLKVLPMAFVKTDQMLKLAAMSASRFQGITIGEVQDRFRVSRRTAQRMLHALEVQFLETETFVDNEGYKRWRRPAGAKPNGLTLTAQELAAFDLAAEAMAKSGAPEAQDLQSLRDKITALIPQGAVARIETDHEALLESQGLAFRPGPRSLNDPHVTATISHAVQACSLIRISYRKQTERTIVTRTIAPIGIITGIRRYLVACKPNQLVPAKPRLFIIDNIEAIKLLDRPFRRDPSFNLETYCEQSFGVYQSEAELSDVVLRFSAAAAEQVRRFQFHPTQSLEDLPDGRVVVRFRASGLIEMTWHLYAWGVHVEVLKPNALRDMVHPYRRSDFFLGP